MTNAFSSIGFPHWLMIAGGLLLLLGLIGLTMRRGSVEKEPDPVVAEQEIFKVEGDLAEPEVPAPPAEKEPRDRSANRELAMKEAAEFGPEFYGKRPG